MRNFIEKSPKCTVSAVPYPKNFSRYSWTLWATCQKCSSYVPDNGIQKCELVDLEGAVETNLE